MDISKLKKGDTVIIEAEVVEVEDGLFTSTSGEWPLPWLSSKVIKEIIKPAFNWDDVKAGMAFHNSSDLSGGGEPLHYYIGKALNSPNHVVVSPSLSVNSDNVRLNHIDNLTRAPEHDIEVTQ